jgi:hypothetical protein
MPPKQSGSRSKKYTVAAPAPAAAPAAASRSKGKTRTTAAPASRSKGKTHTTATPVTIPGSIPVTVPAPDAAAPAPTPTPAPEAEAAAASTAIIPASATPSTFSSLMEKVPIPLSEIKERVERSAGSLYNGFMDYVAKGKKTLVNEADRKSRVEKEYKDLNEEQKEMWKMGVMATTAAIYAAKYAAVIGAGILIGRTLRRGGKRRNRNTRKRHSG